MNVGYGYSITELENKLIAQLKSNRLFMIFLYIILFYIMISSHKCNYIYDLLLFTVNYYLM